MNVELATTEPATPREAGHAGADRLGSLLDWGLLRRAGYDHTTSVLAPDPTDPIFGFVACKTAACSQVATTTLGLCWRCSELWRREEQGADFARFCATAPPSQRQRRTHALCRVCRTTGHERPVRAYGLCAACEKTIEKRGQSADEYVLGDGEFPPASPRPSFGRCGVAACTRFAWRAQPKLCEQHFRRWSGLGRPAGDELAAFCARQGSLDRDSRIVVLAGVAPRPYLELLYGLSRSIELGRRARPTDLQTAVGIVRSQGVATILEVELDQAHQTASPWRFLSFTIDQVRLAMSSRAIEAEKDEWDLRVFGHSPGRLYFSGISQDWLRETTKTWAAERIETVETARVVQGALRAVVALSASFRRNRADHGDDPCLLARSDFTTFTNDLSHLEARGELARNTRRQWLNAVGRFFRDARAMGLGQSGGPLCGLAENAVLLRSDRVPGASREDQGRALPQVVLDQLLDAVALGVLEASAGADVRAMFELAARVGRRTGELCSLRLECLATEEVLDETGTAHLAPVLVHDMPKVNRRRYRLPIDEETAEIVRAQQLRVATHYPVTARSSLALFPTAVMNPRGDKGYSASTFAGHVRVFVDGLDRLVGEDGEPYDRAGITPYSFRHSFAQRHADSGTPIEVLAELMGHTRLTTTQVYYRVTEKRKRKAVDLLAKLQVDHAGQRTRPLVERLLETEAVREAVGQVAVPFGICTEPTNVKAHGQVCPFRHQCLGCTYFRSDPSFLPELRAHLARLLADQERLRAAAPELEEWARSAAVPSAGEVAALRAVVARCEEVVEDLDEDERGALEEAVVVLRRVRAQLDTSVPVRFRGVVAQGSATLFPHLGKATDGSR